MQHRVEKTHFTMFVMGCISDLTHADTVCAPGAVFTGEVI